MCHDVEERWWKYQRKANKTLHHIVLQLYQILRDNYLLRNCVEEGTYLHDGNPLFSVLRPTNILFHETICENVAVYGS